MKNNWLQQIIGREKDKFKIINRILPMLSSIRVLFKHNLMASLLFKSQPPVKKHIHTPKKRGKEAAVEQRCNIPPLKSKFLPETVQLASNLDQSTEKEPPSKCQS